MVAVDGKRWRGSYQLVSEHSTTEPHPAIQLVSVYLVERGLILEPYEVEHKSNEIKVLPQLVKQFACNGVVFAFDAINTQKSCTSIVESHNHYLGALKGNQSGLLKEVKANFQVEDTYTEFSKGHGRIEERNGQLLEIWHSISIGTWALTIWLKPNVVAVSA